MHGDKCCKRSCICPVSLGLAVGLTCGLLAAILAWVAMGSGYGDVAVTRMSEFYYYGYAATFVGGLWGALWGFIKGFIFGFLVALFYDGISCCLRRKCKTHDACCDVEKK